jgi:hypothetical protein
MTKRSSIKNLDMKEGRWCPDECPITGRPFFMWLEHPELGYVPTYGGPFDSYTIATLDEDKCPQSERYDHDAGDWVGCEAVTARDGILIENDLPFISMERYNRVNTFVNAYATRRGLDPNVIHGLDSDKELRVDDLRALLAAAVLE